MHLLFIYLWFVLCYTIIIKINHILECYFVLFSVILLTFQKLSYLHEF